jgi:SAM-dependent methyltransferase
VSDPFPAWFEALERRHLAALGFAEVRRALQALSSLYVERRGKIASGAAFEGAGKRAAFALYYGPLHFLIVRRIVRELGAGSPPPARLIDLGCGSGAASAAWALEAGGTPAVLAVDKYGWAVAEAAWTLAAFKLRGNAVRADIERVHLPGPGDAVLAAFTLNELEEEARERLRKGLIEAGRQGARVLVVEPLSQRVAPWWPRWASTFTAAGGRDDEWRFKAVLPERLALLDKAAGLDHRELTARSLWLPGLRPRLAPRREA